MTSTLSFNTVLGGRYRLTERIAAGGQGEVWRAEDTALGRPTALKVLRGEYAGDADFRERFRREAQHAAMLSHPGIAQVFDYNEGDHGTAPYLVMEYVDGESLSAAIAREAPMSLDRVLDIIIAAASALAAAHAAGLVHRDVKPGNLLLGRDGSIKITDFGIARVMDASPLTRTGILMGTPLYLSPEQATGRRATAASDLYALGILAYEMLVGSPPYEGPPTAVLLAHRDTPLPPLPTSVPSGLAELVHALTAKKPATRPHTATDVVDWAIRLRADPAMTALDAQGPDNAPLSAITPLDQPIPGLEHKARPEGVTQVLAQPLESARRRRALPLALGGLAIASIVGIAGWLALPADQHRPSAVQSPPPVQSLSPPSPSPSPSKTRTAPPIKHPKPAARVPDHRASHGKHGRHGKHRH
jgi:eukaryotic-like serine/threonine-protein kinase